MPRKKQYDQMKTFPERWERHLISVNAARQKRRQKRLLQTAETTRQEFEKNFPCWREVLSVAEKEVVTVKLWGAPEKILSFQEVGERLGVSKQAAHKVYARAMDRLKNSQTLN